MCTVPLLAQSTLQERPAPPLPQTDIKLWVQGQFPGGATLHRHLGLPSLGADRVRVRGERHERKEFLENVLWLQPSTGQCRVFDLNSQTPLLHSTPQHPQNLSEFSWAPSAAP